MSGRPSDLAVVPPFDGTVTERNGGAGEGALVARIEGVEWAKAAAFS